MADLHFRQRECGRAQVDRRVKDVHAIGPRPAQRDPCRPTRAGVFSDPGAEQAQRRILGWTVY